MLYELVTALISIYQLVLIMIGLCIIYREENYAGKYLRIGKIINFADELIFSIFNFLHLKVLDIFYFRLQLVCVNS